MRGLILPRRERRILRFTKILIASVAMELQISMIPSPEDPPWSSDDYQSELRNLGLTLKADGLEIRDVASQPARAGTPLPLTGEWKVKFDDALAPILQTPVGSWLQARRGRTARLRIGEIEADVRTVEELVRVIKVAKCYQAVTESES